MNLFKMPPQIVRLVLLTVAIVGIYAVARVLLTPQSFGDYGHYRGLALEEAASHQPVYAGMKACDECHAESLQKLGKGEHRLISCESCHGPSRTHAENPDKKPVKLADSLCLRCHEANPARPVWLKQVAAKDHYAGRCIECHVPHQPKEVP